MNVCDPAQFLNTLDKETYSGIEERFGNIERFLGPGDRFKFTCDRSGKCCVNREDNPIVLTPYDTFRLQSRLDICSEEFAENYGHRLLGGQSELPIMTLQSRPLDEKSNRCVFLSSPGCQVYEDRPLVCRMYPVGRMVDTELNSYFFLTKTADYCRLGSGHEYTIEEWLEEKEADPYLEWSERFHSLYMKMDHKKYHSLHSAFKATFGELLYNFEVTDKLFPEGLPSCLNLSGKASSIEINLELARIYTDRFLK